MVGRETGRERERERGCQKLVVCNKNSTLIMRHESRAKISDIFVQITSEFNMDLWIWIWLPLKTLKANSLYYLQVANSVSIFSWAKRNKHERDKIIRYFFVYANGVELKMLSVVSIGKRCLQTSFQAS